MHACTHDPQYIRQACHTMAVETDTQVPKRAADLNPAHRINCGYNPYPERHGTFRNHYPAGQIDADLARANTRSAETERWIPATITGFKRFPFNNFTCYLTLFSKCFSSFPHGTCSLSVSCQYLALDEIYHPLWAAFPNNSTLRNAIVEWQVASQGRDFHPLWCSIPGDLDSYRHRTHFFKLQFREGTSRI